MSSKKNQEPMIKAWRDYMRDACDFMKCAIPDVSGEFCAGWNAREKEIKDLQDAISMFPKTADGVVITPKMECWHVDKEGFAHCYVADGFDFYQVKTMVISKTCLFSFCGSQVYSTRSAALAAKGEGK